jgi:tight adherence protein C
MVNIPMTASFAIIYALAATGAVFLAVSFVSQPGRTFSKCLLAATLTIILTLGLAGSSWVLLTSPVIIITRYFITRKLQREKVRDMERETPQLIDFLAFNVEAGSSVYHSLLQAEKVLDPDRPLAKTLRETKGNVDLGLLSQADAMDEMAAACAEDDFNSPYHAIARAIRNGTPLVATLKKQTDQLRTRMLIEGERQANVLAVKLLLPLIIFIFPASFLVILSPVLVILIGGA